MQSLAAETDDMGGNTERIQLSNTNINLEIDAIGLSAVGPQIQIEMPALKAPQSEMD